jgi:hypothetical protein
MGGIGLFGKCMSKICGQMAVACSIKCGEDKLPQRPQNMK